jgi:FtsZ-interacting cell division protein ZipA
LRSETPGTASSDNAKEDEMSTWVWIVIAIAAVIVVAAVVWSGLRTRRTRTLREGFGPEYDRTVADAPSKREAEAELDARRKRREQLDIQPLSQSARDRYASQWKDTQARFVDDPEEAVGEADALIQQVMRERGYPVEDFDQRTADVSVDHPDVVNNYRAAHAISVANTRGNATTDDLRQAMVHYRALFVELLDEREPATAEARQ